jgi:hypothetical protein
MTCNCIQEINARLKEHRVCLSVAYQPLTGKSPVAAVPLVRRDTWNFEKRRGKPRDIIATFCPWCGVRYEAAEVEATP